MITDQQFDQAVEQLRQGCVDTEHTSRVFIAAAGLFIAAATNRERLRIGDAAYWSQNPLPVKRPTPQEMAEFLQAILDDDCRKILKQIANNLIVTEPDTFFAALHIHPTH